MNVVIFSDSDQLSQRLKSTSFSILPFVQFRKTLNQLDTQTIVYLDITGQGASLRKYINPVLKKPNIFFGILDPLGETENAFEFFLEGAVDYLSQKEIDKNLDEKRIKRIGDYVAKYRSDYAVYGNIRTKKGRKKADYIPAGNSWNDIIPGNEYTFSIMFIELDGIAEMEKKFGRKNLENALEVFHRYIEKQIYPFEGRIWTWFRFGGIILFPFNGKECHSVLCGFRIVLYKLIHDVEESFFPNLISFRIALHLGNLKYRRKNTGDVVSDSINSIFHLGKRYTPPGNFYLTEDILEFAPSKLKDYFKPAGSYEERSILRMRLPVV